MERVKRSALVPFSAEKMYRLVADIPRYPEFLRWCRDARIDSAENDIVIASITISFKGLEKTFTTRNAMHPEQGISAIAISLWSICETP